MMVGRDYLAASWTPFASALAFPTIVSPGWHKECYREPDGQRQEHAGDDYPH